MINDTRQAPRIPARRKLLWIGVDLDGTLAEPVWTPDNPTSDIGDPIWSNVQKAIIHTSRPWNDYEAIETWLNFYKIPFKDIQCGKPLYTAYINDRAIIATADSWLPNESG